MLWTAFLVLIVLWMLGVVSSYTLGGFIHDFWSGGGRIVIQLIQGNGSLKEVSVENQQAHCPCGRHHRRRVRVPVSTKSGRNRWPTPNRG
jgi:hypothetical protein